MAYQWENSTGTTFGTIAGATGSTYTVASADLGMYIRVHETVSNVYSASRGPVSGTAAPFYSFRGFFDIDRGSLSGSAPTPYSVMNFNSIEAYQSNAGTAANLVRVLDGVSLSLVPPSPGGTIPGSSTGWVWMGGFRSSKAGGTTPAGGIMRIEDPNNGNGGYAGKLEDVLTHTNGGVRTMPCQHPKNSHRYNLLDDTQLLGSKSSLGTSWPLFVSTIGTFSRRIHSVYATYNPSVTPITSIVEFRSNQIADWVGYVDELWFDNYPNAKSGYDATLVPAVAGTADAAGMPYIGICSAHDYTNTQYPTPGTFTRQMDEWRATNSRGIIVYAWNASISSDSLSTDTTSGLREQIGVEMLKSSS